MKYSTDRFEAAVAGSHRVETMVQAWRGVELLADDVPIEGGQVSFTSEAVPGELSLSVPLGRGNKWDPTGDPWHPLAPYGQQLVAARGIHYSDDDVELLDLGRFVITDAEPNYDDGTVDVTAAPLEQLLADAVVPVPAKPKDYYQDAFVAFSFGLVPAAPLDVVYNLIPLPLTVLFENDALSAVQQVATALNGRAWVNAQGFLRFAPIPDYSTIAPYRTLRGGEGGVLARWGSTTKRDDGVNGYYVTGETGDASGTGVWGAAADMDPDSPTYWLGPYGMKLASYSSPLLTTNRGCAATAATLLAKAQRAARPVEVTMVPDPRIELADWLAIDTDTVRGRGVVTAMTIPLTAAGGAMTLTLGMEPDNG